jgi:hypothetical protein
MHIHVSVGALDAAYLGYLNKISGDCQRECEFVATAPINASAGRLSQSVTIVRMSVALRLYDRQSAWVDNGQGLKPCQVHGVAETALCRCSKIAGFFRRMLLVT